MFEDKAPTWANVLSPFPHGRQLAVELPPSVKEYLPEGHRVHKRSLPAFENVPGAHEMHTLGLEAPCSVEYLPASQLMQFEGLDDPSPEEEYVPAGQLVHCVAPETVE